MKILVIILLCMTFCMATDKGWPWNTFTGKTGSNGNFKIIVDQNGTTQSVVTFDPTNNLVNFGPMDVRNNSGVFGGGNGETALTIQNDGSPKTTTANTVNFTGNGVVVSMINGVATIDIITGTSETVVLPIIADEDVYITSLSNSLSVETNEIVIYNRGSGSKPRAWVKGQNKVYDLNWDFVKNYPTTPVSYYTLLNATEDSDTDFLQTSYWEYQSSGNISAEVNIWDCTNTSPRPGQGVTVDKTYFQDTVEMTFSFFEEDYTDSGSAFGITEERYNSLATLNNVNAAIWLRDAGGNTDIIAGWNVSGTNNTYTMTGAPVDGTRYYCKISVGNYRYTSSQADIRFWVDTSPITTQAGRGVKNASFSASNPWFYCMSSYDGGGYDGTRIENVLAYYDGSSEEVLVDATKDSTTDFLETGTWAYYNTSYITKTATTFIGGDVGASDGAFAYVQNPGSTVPSAIAQQYAILNSVVITYELNSSSYGSEKGGVVVGRRWSDVSAKNIINDVFLGCDTGELVLAYKDTFGAEQRETLTSMSNGTRYYCALQFYNYNTTTDETYLKVWYSTSAINVRVDTPTMLIRKAAINDLYWYVAVGSGGGAASPSIENFQIINMEF